MRRLPNVFFWGLALALAAGCASNHANQPKGESAKDLAAIERPRIIAKAARYLSETPITVTASQCARSAGGEHDFYSEADYFWPDPKNPDGPYRERDGESNPGNFNDHRMAMQRMAEIVGTLASAYVLTKNDNYADHAARHLKAWFADPRTMMNPNLQYGQAVRNGQTGRSYGIIDTLHLVEVARAALIVRDSKAFPPEDFEAVQKWFREYLDWLNNSEFGKKERDSGNNHSVCWSVQAAAFAELVGDAAELSEIRRRFKDVFIVKMMNEKGAFPAEIRRTKPYGYSLFTIDAVANVAQIASVPGDDLWAYKTPDGRGLALGMKFIHPYIKDKQQWLKDGYKQDVMHWDDWPARQSSLVFGGYALHRPEYLETAWKLPADPEDREVIRNLPLRHPLLWLQADGSPRHFTVLP